MRNIIIAVALTFASSASFANGFSPWNERAISAASDHSISQSAAVEYTGFAPWRDRNVQDTFNNEIGVVMDIAERNIFRPWS